MEGSVSHLYLDTRDFVTAGIGCLADPASLATAMPWKCIDGSPATRQEIFDEFGCIKSLKAGMTADRYAKYCNLHLEDADIMSMCVAKADAFWLDVVKQFVSAESWPADAQLGILSMCYARGPYNFRSDYPHFSAAMDSEDWVRAAAQCHMNGCSAQRNTFTAACFEASSKYDDYDSVHVTIDASGIVRS